MFETVADIPALGRVYSARADLEDERGHRQDAVECERTALRLTYVHPDPHNIAVSHHNLANYLSRAAANPAEHRAHRLAATLVFHLIGDTHNLTSTLRALATELRRDSHGPHVPTLPTTLPEVIGLVDAGDGVRCGDLVAALCPDPDTADRALADLLARVATLPDQPADNAAVDLDRYLTEWDPVITAVSAAASTGHTPTELNDRLDQLASTTDWAALVAALRRVLAGDHDQLLAGLDDTDAAILTAVFDRLPTDDERPG